MNREDIIRLAIEHTSSGLKFDEDGLIRFAKLVAEHERKACADIADYKLDNKGLTASDSPKEWWNYACKNIADAIRARGQA